MRRVKTNTGYFFDSFKHFKNNLLNLITLELTTLDGSKDLNEYLSLKSVNYKSKLPDMKKIGLINYDKPKYNEYVVMEEGAALLNIFRNYSYYFNYNLSKSRNKSFDIDEINNLLSEEEIEIMNENSLKLILSYYDSSDFIRPYLLLVKYIENNKYFYIDDDVLKLILAQRKIDILNNNINPDAYDILDDITSEQLKRPMSYIKNYLHSSGVIDSNNNVILDKKLISKILLEMEEINFYNYAYNEKESVNSRSATLQKQFREEVLENYNYECIISGTPIHFRRGHQTSEIFILDAAHIIPYSEGGSFSVTNGIAITPELHKLFDLGLFTFRYVGEGKLEIIISENETIIDNGLLKSISGKIIELSSKKYPDPIAIEYRKKLLI